MRQTVVMELPTQLRYSFHLFFVICSAVVARNVAIQQALDAFGPQILGSLYLTFPVIAGLGVLGLGWLARNADARRVARAIHVIVAATMVLCFFAPPWPAVVFAKYVVLELGFAAMLLAFGVVMGASIGPREARQIAGRVGAGGILGGLCAGAILLLGAKLIGSNALFLGCGALALAPVFWLPRTQPGLSRRATQRIQLGDSVADVPALAPYGRWVAVTTLLMSVATTFIDYQYRFKVDESYSSNDMAAFFGMVVFLAGIATLLFQLSALDLLLNKVGLFGTATVMPGALILCSAAFGMTPVLTTLVVLKVVDSGTNMSIQQATGNLLLAPLRPQARSVWQGRIDGIAKRGGQSLTGLLLALFAWRPTQIVPIVLLLCALWIVSVLVTRVRYVRLLTQMLGSTSNNQAQLEVLDGATVRLLETELATADPTRAGVILDLLEQAGHQAPTHLLERLIEKDPQQPTIIGVIEHLAALGKIKTLLQFAQSPNAAVATEALLALADLDPRVAAHRSRTVFNDATLPEPLRATAAGILCERDGQALKLCRQFARARNQATRLATVQALGRMSHQAPAGATLILNTLAIDPDVEIARAAITSLGRHPTAEGCEVALQGLRRREVRGAAMRALANMGPPAVKRIADELLHAAGRPKIATTLTWVLSRIGAATGIPTLVKSLGAPVVQVRLGAAVALSTMARRLPEIQIPQEDVARHCLPEVAYYSKMRTASLGSLPDSPAGTLLRRALKQRAQASLETLFRILSLRFSEEAMQGAFQAINSREARKRQIALELLDTLLDKETSSAIAGAVGGVRRASRRPRRDPVTALDELVSDPDPFLARLATAAQFEVALASGQPNRIPQNTGEIMAQTLVNQILELQSLPLFSHSSAEDLAEVASLISARRVAKNTMLFREGDAGNAMYLLQKGEVTISRGGKIIDTLGPGEAFGIVAVLDQLPREVTAATTVESSLLVLKGDDLLQLLADRPLLMHSVFRALTASLRNQIERGTLGKKPEDWSW